VPGRPTSDVCTTLCCFAFSAMTSRVPCELGPSSRDARRWTGRQCGLWPFTSLDLKIRMEPRMLPRSTFCATPCFTYQTTYEVDHDNRVVLAIYFMILSLARSHSEGTPASTGVVRKIQGCVRRTRAVRLYVNPQLPSLTSRFLVQLSSRFPLQ
jgi:hypothetical protein